jgi:hypothetical protein
MDPITFIQLLGASADDPSVKNLLASSGARDLPKLKKGDTKAYVTIHDKGIFFVFTDEAFFRKARGVKIGVGPLLLTNVTLICAKTGYNRYVDPLPFGLNCSDGRDVVRAKLGPPEMSIDRRRLDRWTRERVWVYVSYTADLQSIESMTVQLPDPT